MLVMSPVMRAGTLQPPPPREQTDRRKNITFPQLCLRAVKIIHKALHPPGTSQTG